MLALSPLQLERNMHNATDLAEFLDTKTWIAEARENCNSTDIQQVQD